MKRMNRVIWTSVFVSLLLWPAVGRAGLVVDHQPFPTGGSASDTDLIDPLSTLTAQRSADDFTVAADATIHHITWWGFYGSNATSPAEQPPATQTFRMRLYDVRPADGLPGDVIHEESFADPLFSATGRRIGIGAGPDEFKFDVNLTQPVSLSAATPYWLEIVQLGTKDSFFGWEFSRSADINGFVFINTATVDWVHTQSVTSDLAFQLSTIPEPSSAALWVIAVITLFSRGGRKGHRHDLRHLRRRNSIRIVQWGIMFLTVAAQAHAGESPWDSVMRGGVVVDHQPWPFGGSASDTELIDPLSALTAQQTADDFSLAVGATIRRISWWGFYGSNVTSPAEQPPVTQNFRVRFYDARPADGLPGNLIHEETFVDPLFVPTGRIIVTGAGPDEFKFDVNLAQPISLSAATPYWLEIVQLGTVDSFFGWELSITEQNGFAFKNAATVDWQHTVNTPGDLAFQLSTIPEPTSASLWAIAVIALFSRGGRKGHRHDLAHLGDSSESTCT